jgi:ABC-type polysaccharide/polyol phosphate export permease
MTPARIFSEAIDFFKQIYYNRNVIHELTKRDFRSKYITNLLGMSWAIIEPLAMMLVLYVVFTYLRSSHPISQVPFALYLLTGLICYDFFNKTINSASKSIKDFSFLIRKVKFRIAILPMVKISSEVLIHFIILAIVMIILIFGKIPVTLAWIQVFYYLFASIVLLIGISWLTASLSLFVPDIKYIITIVMRVLFFFTPIFWSSDNVSGTFKIVLELNPLYYLVTGYRDSLLFNIPFWEKPEQTLIYWGVTFVFMALGIFTFKRLRPHFADVV